MIGELGKFVLEWVYPSDLYCIRCGAAIVSGSELSLCEKCEEELHWVGAPYCSRCGKPMVYPPGQAVLRERSLCGDCLNGRSIRKGYVSLVYDGPEREMLHAFKFGDRPYYGVGIAAIMAKRLKGKDLSGCLVVPVPMHGEKRRQRGYDQAFVLAKALAGRLGLPFGGKVLVRVRSTDPMTKVEGQSRALNVENAFQVPLSHRKKLAGRPVLLVDDIYTTGSTGDACAKALLFAGAKDVTMITAASGYGRWV